MPIDRRMSANALYDLNYKKDKLCGFMHFYHPISTYTTSIHQNQSQYNLKHSCCKKVGFSLLESILTMKISINLFSLYITINVEDRLFNN